MNGLFRKKWIRFQYVIRSITIGDCIDDHVDGHTRSFDDRLPSQDGRIDFDLIKFVFLRHHLIWYLAKPGSKPTDER